MSPAATNPKAGWEVPVLDDVLLLDTHDQLFIVKALLKLVADRQLQIEYS